MRLLLTNDDGIESLGLQILCQALAESHEVWVVAPETEKSGSSHAITLKDSIRVRAAGERRFSCRGTPADCVLISLLGLVPASIDMVVSGINHGPNLGTDILYSGTAGAARQGALMGKPSLALSVGAYAPPFDFQCAADFTARNLSVFREMWSDDHFLNINFPNAKCAEAKPVITFPSRRIYRDELKTYAAPNQDLFCFIGGALPDAHPEEGSDCLVVSNGFISLSPIHVHPQNRDLIEEKYRGARFR